MEKKALMIIAPRDFRDEEYQEPKAILEREGVKVVVASTVAGTARGMFGTQVTPDTTIDEVNPTEFDAVVVVGGSGSQTHLWNNSKVHKIVQALHTKGGLVAAICISPVVLAKAGLLKGRKATVFRTATTINELKKGGAVISDAPVVVDGKIITGRGPEAAREFGLKIAESLSR
ncbi:MAG: DJ-1/PfpI family protein [Candidatus Bathyarchaeota archaeon]|nr:DJ-1/PfpI family protein [Candidatus Bathyarchaeota archaeon]MDH5532416.1 DJ-1/PfpI family protein [Candidatus Bathyarchaeota archaeon]MDH5713509.1 DJ-1/PfpI family protein [Candidatus Bathyarchaeota archaeon]